MSLAHLEKRLDLPVGAISNIIGEKRPRYFRKMLLVRRPSWKPNARAKLRLVWRPSAGLKKVQRAIKLLIADRFEPHPIAHAYVRGRGIVTNARPHVGKEWLFQIDLVNFFGSITHKLVEEALRALLTDFSEQDIGVIADLCCHDGFLPEGSPSAPILSNLVCFPLDRRLEEFAVMLGLTVTRYSDDICFSSASAKIPRELAKVRGLRAAQKIVLGLQLRALFCPYGFDINLKKVRFQDRSGRQQVTGLVVNDGINIPGDCYDIIRETLHLWNKRGIEVAAWHLQRHYGIGKFRRSLRGLIGYVGQVRGVDDNRYLDFLKAFEELVADEHFRVELVL